MIYSQPLNGRLPVAITKSCRIGAHCEICRPIYHGRVACAAKISSSNFCSVYKEYYITGTVVADNQVMVDIIAPIRYTFMQKNCRLIVIITQIYRNAVLFTLVYKQFCWGSCSTGRSLKKNIVGVLIRSPVDRFKTYLNRANSIR